MSDMEPSIAKILEAYKSAVHARDVEAFMQLYDAGVRVFDAWGVWSYEGASAWQVAVEGWFAAHPSERIKVSFEDVSHVATPVFASVSAIVTYAGVSAQGEQVRAMQNRLTWALKKSGHVLRIIHEHTSAPVGFEDGKAILQRQSKT